MHQYELWQAEKMNWTWMNGCVKNKIKNCEPPYLSGTENRVCVETKGAFLWRNHFLGVISVCWYKTLYWKTADVIHSLGPWRCSRDQSSHILKLDVFQLFPAESFSCPSLLAYCLQMRLLSCLNSSLFMGFKRDHSYFPRVRMMGKWKREGNEYMKQLREFCSSWDEHKWSSPRKSWGQTSGTRNTTFARQHMD